MPGKTLDSQESWAGDRDREAVAYTRLAAVTIVILLGAAPWIVAAALSVLDGGATTPIDWVPPSFPARRNYDTFAAQFETGDVVVASWTGCRLGAPAIGRFIEAATGLHAPRAAGGSPWFLSATSGADVLERLRAPPLALATDEAIARLRGVLVGPDGEQTCIVIGFSPAGLEDRRAAVAWIREVLRDTAGVTDDALHLAGPVIDNLAVDDASDESLRIYGGPAAAIVFVLSWLALRSFRCAAVVFLVSLTCVGLAFTSLAAWGDRMNPVLIVMPLLVLTLGVSAGIHLVNYIVAERWAGVPGSTARGVRMAALPCGVSAGTTALGLLSLVVSDLEPIRVFGFHAAVGVIGTFGLPFLVLPGVLARWPIDRSRVPRDRDTGRTRPARWVIRHASTIVAIVAAVLLVAVAGLPGIRTSVGIDTLFGRESRVLRDYAWLEEAIGPLVPVEVVMRFATTGDVRAAERLAVVGEVSAALRTLAPVSGVVSAELFLPDLPDLPAASAARSVARKAVIARRLEGDLTRLAVLRLVREDAGGQLWRITARTAALAGLDYGDFLGDVRRVVAVIVESHDGADRGITVEYTGAMPLINAIQRTLLRDLCASFLTACCVISVVTMLVVRGVAAGALAMIPNVFPILLLFGGLGWSRARFDIGSVMTASVALGMAVDGSFHFLTFFRHGLGAPGAATCRRRRMVAAHMAFRHAARPLIQTAVVCGVGILAFAPSAFAPTRRFALLLSALVGTALVGDLVVLPAILVSRLGRWFRGPSGSRLPGGGGENCGRELSGRR